MKKNNNDHYFEIADPFIDENEKLREPQIKGYFYVYEHFVIKKKTEDAIVVLPTGVGKTGLMGLLPYNICKGKALIITPQLTIKDTVLDSLDPDNPNSFWYKRGVFKDKKDTPVIIEYDKEMPEEVLEKADIIILNIHKLQSRLSSSPLNFLRKDYFDMIIIDEAHHSTANTWVETIDYFDEAKVVKLTGTPIRTDGVELAGKLVYRYKLSQAMAKGYVKSLRNFEYIPEQLYLTIDGDETKKYTIDELLEKGIRDDDWIRRSVAYSTECSRSVVKKSIELLIEKRRNSTVPHKIIAVACSIKHAEQIKQLYQNEGYNAEVIHSKQGKVIQDKIKKDIENDRIDVIINVAMLGEGYDHPYLSIGAIFRPFISQLPYEQFIGRVLRAIPDGEVTKADDNIADIIAHKNLDLFDLWRKYKREIDESEIIKHLQDENILTDDIEGPDLEIGPNNVIELGNVSEQGNGKLTGDAYLDTELIKKRKEEEQKEKEKIAELQKLLHIGAEQAKTIYDQTITKETNELKRPDKYFINKKRNLDIEIRDVIVPEIITKYGIDQFSTNLAESGLFDRPKYSWIKRQKNNGAMLAIYINTYLKDKIGGSRDTWETPDFERADKELKTIKDFIGRVLNENLQIE
ncbi:DEAD/DEAH box helicase [Pectinatus frisingensis]|uniref:DEAD/DEAH box helicase n=1 Tax=Pectinatus frisingensis TaxID=865 RepID=UPI0018C671F8|nr:DEAD/DEAH box helicase family protein [Pectinatus frisingensis]